MNLRRALVTAAPLAIAGAIGIGGGAGSASAATALPVQLPGLQLPQLPIIGSLNLLNLGSVTSTVTAPLNTVTGLLGGLGVKSLVPALGGAAAAGPSSNAAANGLNLGIIDTCVSCTGASAGPSSAAAGAHALRVLGTDLSAGQVSGNNANSGALIALPANGLLGLAIADFMNSSQSGSSASSAHSRSALTDLNLGNGQIATVAVLESLSNATFGGSSTHGDATNNGVDLSLLNGGVALILLHSDVAGDGTQTTYVASLNGTQLLASHGNSGIPIAIPGVGTINLLSAGAAGGPGTAISTIDDLLGGAGQAAGVLTASGGPAAIAGSPNSGSGSGNGSSAAPVHQPVSGAVSGPTAADTSAPTPFTGISLGLGGFALVMSGLGILGASIQRRRRATI